MSIFAFLCFSWKRVTRVMATGENIEFWKCKQSTNLELHITELSIVQLFILTVYDLKTFDEQIKSNLSITSREMVYSLIFFFLILDFRCYKSPTNNKRMNNVLSKTLNETPNPSRKSVHKSFSSVDKKTSSDNR